MNKSWVIYQIQNVVNGKYYIGYTENFTVRWELHRQDAKNGNTCHFYCAIRKYGVAAFKHQILAQTRSLEDAKQLEKLWIAALRSFDRSIGYNMTYGGDGVVHLPETKEKMSRKCREAWIKRKQYRSITDGVTQKRILIQEAIPIGWRYGRTPFKKKNSITAVQKLCWARQRRAAKLVCYFCYKSFTPSSKEQVFCSNSCSNKAQRTLGYEFK